MLGHRRVIDQDLAEYAWCGYGGGPEPVFCIGVDKPPPAKLPVPPDGQHVAFRRGTAAPSTAFTGTRERVDLALPDGSCLIMAGPTQHHWLHQIPKTARPVGPRINLTFRRMNGPEARHR